MQSLVRNVIVTSGSRPSVQAEASRNRSSSSGVGGPPSTAARPAEPEECCRGATPSRAELPLSSRSSPGASGCGCACVHVRVQKAVTFSRPQKDPGCFGGAVTGLRCTQCRRC